MTSPTETAKHYGGGLKGNALRERFRRDITPFVQPMVDAVRSGIDPLKAVPISESGKGQICFSDTPTTHSTFSFCNALAQSAFK